VDKFVKENPELTDTTESCAPVVSSAERKYCLPPRMQN